MSSAKCQPFCLSLNMLTYGSWVTHICVSKLTIIGSDNGLSPGRRQAIIWTNAGILLIGTLGTNFSEILIECHSFSFKKMHMNMSSGKWRPSCLSLNMLKFSSCIREDWCNCIYYVLIISYGVLTAGQHLKSPKSLSCTSPPPPHHGQPKSWSCSWMIHLHPFHAMSISPSIPYIGPFQALKIQGQGHRYGQTRQQFLRYNYIFFLTSATPMALGQSHRQVTQYISPDQYFLCPKC